MISSVSVKIIGPCSEVIVLVMQVDGTTLIGGCVQGEVARIDCGVIICQACMQKTAVVVGQTPIDFTFRDKHIVGILFQKNSPSLKGSVV
jgi:hypothetical protein